MTFETEAGGSPHRYEFRCWPSVDVAEAVGARLEKEWRDEGADDRQDVYLLLPHRPAVLAKLRDAKSLDIKERVSTHDALELWAPRVTAAFPLDAPALAAVQRLAPELSALKGCADARDAMRAADAHAQLADVRKQRRRYSHSGVRAETTLVTLGGIAVRTIAVEGTDPATTAAAARLLSIDGFENLHYGARLSAATAP